jgi:hypothetical protein
MDAKLVAQLIDFYKAKGLDLHFLLDDPYFMALKLDQKIQAVKEHAQEILEGTPIGPSKLDYKKFRNATLSGAAIGAFSGAASGLAATHLFTKGNFNPIVLGSSAIIGAAYGGLTGAWNERKNLANRAQIHNQLKRVVEEPTETNALHTLMLRNMQNKNLTGTNKILDTFVGDQTNQFLKKIQEHAKNDTIAFNTQLGNKLKST